MTDLPRAPRALFVRYAVAALAATTILLSSVGAPAPASADPPVASVADPQEHDADAGGGDHEDPGAPPVAPDAVTPSTGAARVVGKLVLQNRSSGPTAYVGVSAPVSGGHVQRLYSPTAGGAASLAGTYSLPAVGTAGPITGTGDASALCLAPDSVGHRALVSARTCTGASSQDFHWRYVSNTWVSGYALYPVSSSYSLGGTDTDTYVELSLNGITDVVAQSHLAPIEPFALQAPAIGATVDTPTPVFSGIGQPGALVSIRTDAQVLLASTLVPADSTSWSVASTNLAPGRYTGTATQSRVGPDVQVRFDFTVGAPAVTIPDVSVQQGATIEVPVAFTETALGATEIVVPEGFERGTATAGFVWDASLPGFRGTVTAAERDITLSLTAKDDAALGERNGLVRQPGTGLSRQWKVAFEPSGVTPVLPLVVESPRLGETIRETTPVFSGTGQPGSRIEVRGAWGDLMGAADPVDASGSWSITWNKNLRPGRYVGGTVKQIVAGAPPQTFVYDFTVGPSDVAPLVVTSPKVGEVITDQVPVFTGTAQPGAALEIRGAWGDLLGSIDEVDASGAWSITWNKGLLPNRYAGGTVQQIVDGFPTHTFVYDFTLVQSRLTIESPQLGDTITGTRPVFSGRANPGATVQIRGVWGTDLGSAVADKRTGAWAITWPRDYQPGRYSGGTVTETVGGKPVGSFVYDFTLTR